MTRCGLFATHSQHQTVHQYPLIGAKAQYRVLDTFVCAEVIQTYKSHATIADDVTFIFPLPPDGAVSAFKAVVDGERTINGIVREKEEAKAEYEAAVSQGKKAALLQQHTVDVFQLSLGNLEPGQTMEIHITITFIIPSDVVADSLRLTVPVAIGPRYGAPPPELSLARGASVTFGIQLTVDVEMTSNISSISSTTHPISLRLGSTSSSDGGASFDPKKAHISLGETGFLLEDVVISITCSGLDKPRCMVESWPGTKDRKTTDAYALTLVPRFGVPPLSRQEYIFLIDRSGSMQGARIAAVRTALQIMLRSLPTQNTSINLVSFGTRHTSLWPVSVPYTAGSVSDASKHVDKLDANYGGTEIMSALDAAFNSRNTEVHDRVRTPTAVFVLTDGEAWDLDNVLKTVGNAVKAAREDGGLLRVFVLGVGDGVSKAMCDGIARAGKGIAVYVGNNEKPDSKLMGLLKAARGGLVEDIQLNWGVGEKVPEEQTDGFEMVSAEAEPQPATEQPSITLYEDVPESASVPALGPQELVLPPPPRIQQAPSTESLSIPIYPGFRCSIFAIIQREPGQIPSDLVKLTGSVLGRRVVLEIPVTRAAVRFDDTKVLHILAARALIQSFEDDSNVLASETSKKEIIRLGTTYSLTSSQTSFVAIDSEGHEVGIAERLETLTLEDSTPSPARKTRTKQTARRSTGGKAPRKQLGHAIQQQQLVALPPQQHQFMAFASPSLTGPPPTQARSRGSPRKRRAAAKVEATIGNNRDRERDRDLYQDYESHDEEMEVETSGVKTSGVTIEFLARAQSFDGSFPVDVLHSIGYSDVPTGFAGKEAIWSTLLVLEYLKKNFGGKEERETWSLIGEKAEEYLRAATSEMGIGQDDLEKWCREAADAIAV